MDRLYRQPRGRIPAGRIILGSMLALVSTFVTVRVAVPAHGEIEQTTTDQEGHAMVEHATFAAGCFWGVEALFRQQQGVVNSTVGYTGGTTKKPTYEDVCHHNTGHAEAVLVEYDPAQVTYEQLLELFFRNHNPTTPNRQGPDWGSQYRSAVFYHTPAQQSAAEAMKRRLDESRRYSSPIVTQIVPAPEFYKAEEYHQRYDEKQGGGQCHSTTGGQS